MPHVTHFYDIVNNEKKI